MVNTLTPDALRSECAWKGLITRHQEKRFSASASPTQQNEALLDAIRADDDRSFHIFLECIRNVEPKGDVNEILVKLDSMGKYREAEGRGTDDDASRSSHSVESPPTTSLTHAVALDPVATAA